MYEEDWGRNVSKKPLSSVQRKCRNLARWIEHPPVYEFFVPDDPLPAYKARSF